MQRGLRLITLQGAIKKRLFRILVLAIIFSPTVSAMQDFTQILFKGNIESILFELN